MEIRTLCIPVNLQITYSKLIMESWKTFAAHVQNFLCPNIQLTYSKLHTRISKTYKKKSCILNFLHPQFLFQIFKTSYSDFKNFCIMCIILSAFPLSNHIFKTSQLTSRYSQIMYTKFYRSLTFNSYILNIIYPNSKNFKITL